ncbi:MAG: polysaccharide biosynthesis protein, partial [Acidobacteria bacterium]|nr:polysaccharide biosynthesis protein [Acidobacteriota bacterium]
MELERLLDRSLSIAPHPEPEGIRDRAVLVTGAGGSIGSALSRRLLNCRPARLLLLDRSEFNLHKLRLDLEDQPAMSTAEFLLGDLLEAGLLEEVLLRTPPDIVFHVAAFKQVPMLERHPLAALRNNTLVTAALVRALADDGDKRLVTISTDKAVNPRSILGASKRIAELVLLSFAVARPRGTAIRLGNVLGSCGSVLPRFREQVASRRPLTVTHPDAARYFVTTAEAVGLILRASDLGVGGD